MKKIICLVLAAMAIMALCACGVKDDIKGVKMPKNGVTADQIDAWMDTIAAREEAAEASNVMPEGRWYKLTMDKYTQQSYENYTYEQKAEIRGKIYVAPIEYQCKGKVEISSVAKTVEQGVETVVESKAIVVIVSGEMYMSVSVETKTASGSQTDVEKIYERTSMEIFEELIDDMLEIFDTDNEHAQFFKKGEVVGVRVQKSEAEESQLIESVVEFEEESAKLKSAVSYSSTQSTQNNSTSKRTVRLEIKTCSGTTVKRPGDYYNYKGV